MKVVKHIARVALYAAGGIVLLLLLLAAATQTQFFRDRVRAFALAQLDSVLIAHVEMGPVTGNLVTGFAIDGLSIVLGPDTIVQARQVGLRYNIFELPGKTISVHSLVLDRPVVRMLRSRSGTWNLDAMMRPTAPDTAAAPFDWAIHLQRLEIIGGTVVLVDSTSLDDAEDPDRPPDAIDYDHIQLTDLSLALSLRIQGESYGAQITRFSAAVAGTPVRVKHMSGAFDLDSSSVRVTDFRILTDSSHVGLEAGLFGINLLAGADLHSLGSCSTAVDLQADPLAFGELGRILPATHFLRGSVVAALQAEGPFGALPVSALDVQFGDSRLFLEGTVSNLHDPAGLHLDVHLRDTRIHPADPPALMPDFDIPDFSSLDAVRMDVTFVGTPLDFTVRSTFDTEAGRVATDNLALRIGGPNTLRYRGTVRMEGLDLGRVLDQSGLSTRLNGTAVLEGSGVSVDRLASAMHVKLDSSQFRAFPLHDAEAHIRARGRKIDGRLQLGIGDASFRLTAELDERDPRRPVFSVEGSATRVNLAELLDAPEHASDLNLDLRLQGSGLTLATMEADFRAAVTGSRYRGYKMEDGEFTALVDHTDSLQSLLVIASPFLDARLQGAFSFDYLLRLVDFELQNARLTVSESFARFDSLFSADVDTVALAALRTALERSGETVDCSYDINVKDLQLVSLITGGRSFNGAATVKGALAGSVDRLSYDTHLTVQEFFYGDVASGVLVEEGECRIRAVDLTPVRDYTDADLSVQVAARMVDISSTELDSTLLTIRIKDRHAEYQLRGTLNQRVRMDVQGEARLQEDTIVCRLDRLQAAVDEFAWDADPAVRVAIDRQSIHVSGLTIRRNTGTVRADAVIGVDGAMTVSAHATRLDLEDLRFFLDGGAGESEEGTFTGLLSGSVEMKGTLDDPQIRLSFAADSVGLQGIRFGLMRGDLAYAAGMLDITSTADVTEGAVAEGPELSIAGKVPVRIGRGHELTSEGAYDLTIRSAGTPITILDPLLPNFNQLTGMLTCDLTITGSAERPRYAGSLRLTDAGFLFEANNMYYLVDGSFAADGERISVLQATIRNLPSDERGGQTGLVSLAGDFRLRNFTPGDFRLSAAGQLHVVKEATRKSALSMYGDLFVTIGPGGLRFTGDIDRSLLRGDLSIRNSTLIFPPTEQVVVEESALSVPIIIFDDTTKFGEKAVLSAADRYFGTAQMTGGDRRIKGIAGAVSFLDGLRYDLDIEAAGGSTEIRMIFNPISSEELVATIDGRFSITDDGRRWLGDLEVSRAYYNFYRRFDAEGRIRFTGNFMDPELNIRATYRGTRAVRDTIVGDKDERIVVVVDISGPRSSAQLSMSMTIDDVDYYAYRGLKSNDVQSDALGFIIYGSFPLTMAQKGEVSAEVERTFRRSILTGATSLLTGTLSEFLRTQTGFISSVELNFNTQSGTSESADIRLSGVAWSGYWRYGGQILDDPLGNANFSVLYSFGSIFNKPALRNFMMELESRVERGTLGQAADLKRTNSARLFYRFSF